MLVTEYLKEHGVESLKDEYSINVKEYPRHKLLVLNYSQINSPKTHPIVKECRGLILDSRSYRPVSRSFDRFFNLGEADATEDNIDFSKTYCFEKVDGSLIKLYFRRGFWYIATRGTAFAEAECNGYGVTFRDLVLKALHCKDMFQFDERCKKFLDPKKTYICELTCRENRVVKVYDGYKLHFLVARANKTGKYYRDPVVGNVKRLGCYVAKEYKFDTVEHCVEASKRLKDLDEGYVLYNQLGVPVCKIKSPQYVAVHRLKGEGLSPKRILELILLNEQEEYLRYYPEDADTIERYSRLIQKIEVDMDTAYSALSHIESQKEFAIQVNTYHKIYAPMLFQARKFNSTPSQAFHNFSLKYKITFLKSNMEGFN